jgi:hypothetical protein
VASKYKAKKAQEEAAEAKEGGEEDETGGASDDGTWGAAGEGIAPGMPVQIQGLDKGAQYNGSVGMVESQDGERWVVMLGAPDAWGPGAEAKKLKIKPDNLRVMLKMPGMPGAGGPGGKKKGKQSAREKMEAAMLGMAQKKNDMGE